MRAALFAAALIGMSGLPGCVVVQTGVTNPIPGMTTVAVAPFINLSAERSVDGRRFALAYHAELQKIPGYQVIPVGVTEQTIVDLGLDLDGPDDALTLAKALGADAVVIGAVTDYTPYYPPRIGLQVSWYAPEPWRFSPGVPVDPQLSEAVRVWRFAARKGRHDGVASTASVEHALIVRGQSPDAAASGPVVTANGVGGPNPIQLTGIDASEEKGPGPILFPPPHVPDEATIPVSPPEVRTVNAEVPSRAVTASVMAAAVACPPPTVGDYSASCPPPVIGGMAPFAAAGPRDPRKPIMAYTRLFDGSDAELTALLRDYVVLSGDLRSGGWEAYLHRTEDFLRFASHRMIVEMLTLHGGESKRRYVWLLKRDKH